MNTILKFDSRDFDVAAFAAVQRLIPPQRLYGYLGNLNRAYLQLVNSAPTDMSLQSQAHKIVSQAGMLGLIRMCSSARALEDACQSGARPDEALLQCRVAVGDIQLYAMPRAGAPVVSAPASKT